MHPASVEVMIQLARSLLDAQQFSLAAFRFEQALSLSPDNILAKEAAEAHYLAKDFDSSIERYRQYLSTNPVDPASQLRFARMLADKGQGTESLNAFSKVSNEATDDDCLIMGNLFLQKNLLTQAKYWYAESSSRSEGSPAQALIGLLTVAKREKNDGEAETLILALEKTSPGILETTTCGVLCQSFKTAKTGRFHCQRNGCPGKNGDATCLSDCWREKPTFFARPIR